MIPFVPRPASPRLPARLRRFAGLLIPLLLGCGGAPARAQGGAPAPELWFFYRGGLGGAQLGQFESLVDRAAAAGYRGVVLSDWSIETLQAGRVGASALANLQTALGYAASKGLQVVPYTFSFGHSDALLFTTGINNAEGMACQGAAYTVAPDGRSLVFSNGIPDVQNGGFEAYAGNTFQGWGYQDQPGVRTFADASQSHSGAASLRVGPGTGNGRVLASLVLTPNRQYHVRCFMASQGFSGGFCQVNVLDAATGRGLQPSNLQIQSTQGWTQYDFTVPSGSTSQATLALGVWGASSGNLWIDDVSLEEVPLVNLVRRSGAPLRLYDPANGTTFAEGTDYDPISDPGGLMGGRRNTWHPSPAVTLPAGTRLAPGQRVALDYYACQPIQINASYFQVGVCLSEASVQADLSANLNALKAYFPAPPAVMLNYDEMRHVNSCAACRSQGLGAGQLLGAHAGRSCALVQGAFPGAEAWVWNDMFDPNQNAVNVYYYVPDSLQGSVQGLPAGAVVVNWNLRKLGTSLRFFSSQGHPQIIAGYYDSGDGTASATAESHAATGVAGVRGMMYTTWRGDYGQLEAYAAAALGGWGR